MATMKKAKGARRAAETKAQARAADHPVRFTIYTPHSGFRGERGGVKFVDGVGYTSDEAAARHCRECGYDVEDADEPQDADEDGTSTGGGDDGE